MKKCLTLVFSLILLISLYGCPPTPSPPVYQFDSTPMGEPLLSLPDQVSLVSQDLTMVTILMSEDPQTLNSQMSYHDVFTIHNDANEALEGTVYIPLNRAANATYSMSEVVNNIMSFDYRVNDEPVRLDWRFAMDAIDYSDVLEYNFEAIDANIIQNSTTYDTTMIYRYNFQAPLVGQNQHLSIRIPDGAKVLGYYYHKHISESVSSLGDVLVYLGEDIVVPEFEIETTGDFYIIGNVPIFESDYEIDVHRTDFTIHDFTTHSTGDDFGAEVMKNSLIQFIESDQIWIDASDIFASVGTTPHLSVYWDTFSIPANGDVTIEWNYTIQGGKYTVSDLVTENETTQLNRTVYLTFDFYLDPGWAQNEDVVRTITIDSFDPLTFSNCVIINENQLVYSVDVGNHLHFDLQTRYVYD